MTLDRSDRHGLVYEPERGPPRRILFEPRSDGTWERVEAVWTGCAWRPLGREVVESLRRV